MKCSEFIQETLDEIKKIKYDDIEKRGIQRAIIGSLRVIIEGCKKIEDLQPKI